MALKPIVVVLPQHQDAVERLKALHLQKFGHEIHVSQSLIDDEVLITNADEVEVRFLYVFAADQGRFSEDAETEPMTFAEIKEQIAQLETMEDYVHYGTD